MLSLWRRITHFLLVGWWLAIIMCVFGLILCCTVLFLPYGIKCFKGAGKVLFYDPW